MSYLKNLVIRILAKLSGNNLAQKCLEKNVLISHFFMGIGAGADTSLSGEKAVFKILIRRYNPPYCIFDVGANKGQFINLALSNIASADFIIHGFEPGAVAFKVLKNNAEQNTRIKLNNIGLGKEKTTASLYYNKDGSSIASLTKRKLDHFKIVFDKNESVQIDTIDNYCFENNIDRIHLLKLDIEGHEFDALTGAVNMFNRKNGINIVLFEFGGCNIDTRFLFQDYYYFFKGLNMKIYRITPSGYLYQIESYKEIDEQFRTTNFIAIKDL